VDYFLFLIASSIEYFGTFMLMFALFRFRIRPQVVLNVLLVSFLMSQVSYFTRINPEIESFSMYIQFGLFILVFWILFLIPFFHSIIMNFAGIATNLLAQGLCILISLEITGLTTAELVDNIWVQSSLQVLAALIQLALARTIIIFNWGFDFVPTSPRANVRIRGTNAILIVIISLAVVVTALLAFVFRNNLDIYIVSACVVFLLTLSLFLYYAVRKDFEDAS